MIPPNSNRISLVVFLCVLIAALGACAYMIWPYMLALLMGGLLAILTAPMHRKLAQSMHPRAAAFLTTLAVMLLVVVPLFFFAAHATLQGTEMIQRFKEENFSVQNITTQVSRSVSRTFEIDLTLVRDNVRKGLENVATWLTNSALRLVAAIPNILLQLVLAAIACFFLLLDGHTFLRWLADKIPLDGDVRGELKKSFKNTAISVIWANLAAAACQAALLVIGFLALGVPGAFMAGGAAFVLSWIPMVGVVPVWLAGAVYLYAQGVMSKVVIMVVIGILTGIVDNFVRPLVLRGRSDMHPLVSLVAIFGGLNVFGILGAFVGPILAAILIALLDIWPVVGKRFGLMKSRETTGSPL